MYPSAQTNQPLQHRLSAGPATGDEPLVYLASSVRDADRVDARPGAVAVAGQTVLAAGPTDHVLRQVGRDVQQIDLGPRMLLPGLVNAHTHLQLTPLGTQPYPGRFDRWVMQVRSAWTAYAATFDDAQTAIAAALAQGAKASLDAGVLTVGDITTAPNPTEALAVAGLRGVGFVELLGIGGERLADSRQRLEQIAEPIEPGPAQVCVGLQPHAPYSTGPPLYEAATDAAVQHRLPMSTHLAELAEELQFVSKAAGPMRELLDRLAGWQDEYNHWYGHGQTPVQWMQPYLERAPWLLAHCNYVTDNDIAILAATGASVAYCPRASEYFGHRDHPYRRMMEAGINVCLGTDSIVCHGSLSVVDEMRRLYARDRTDPATLLAMATTSGMVGLGLEPANATFTPGARPGLVAVAYDAMNQTDPLAQVLADGSPAGIEWVVPAG